MVNSAYSEKIKEWLKFSNRDKKWIAHNFCLSDEDVDKWVEDGEAPSREHEETLLQFMNPKVVDLYIYQSWEIAKKILREWRIKGTNPYRTNDIFEFLPAGKTYNDETKHSSHQVICFSRSVSSAAMWGHYADKHKGVCLVFSLPVTPHNEPNYNHWRIEKLHEDFLHNCLYNVLYKRNRVVFPDVFPLFNPKVIEDLMITKDKSWFFEKEMRLLCLIKHASSTDDKGNIFFSEILQYLSGIVLGVRFPHNVHCVQEWYKQLQLKNIEKPEIKIVNSYISPNYFKIENEVFHDTPVGSFPYRKLRPKKIVDNGLIILPGKII